MQTIKNFFSSTKDVEFLDIEQKSDTWLEKRYNFLTSTDIKTILNIKKYNSSYKNLIVNFLEEKAKKKDPNFSDFVKEKMHRGQLYEESLKSRPDIKNKIENHNLLHGKSAIKYFIFTSFDFICRDKDDSYYPIEIKYTESENYYNDVNNLKHDYFYQLAVQMYTLGATKGILHICYVDENNESQTLNKTITTDSQHYKTLMQEMSYLKKCFTKYKELVEQEEQRQEDIKAPVINNELERLYKARKGIEEDKITLKEREEAIMQQVQEEMSSNDLSSYNIENEGFTKAWCIETITKTKQTAKHPYKMSVLKDFTEEVRSNFSKYVKEEEITEKKIIIKKV